MRSVQATTNALLIVAGVPVVVGGVQMLVKPEMKIMRMGLPCYAGLAVPRAAMV